VNGGSVRLIHLYTSAATIKAISDIVELEQGEISRDGTTRVDVALLFKESSLSGHF